MDEKDLLGRLNRISDADTLRKKREDFLKTDYKYHLFKTLCDTAAERFNNYSSLGHDLRTVVYNDNISNMGGIRWEGRGGLIVDYLNGVTICEDGEYKRLVGNALSRSLEWREWLRCFFRDVGVQIVYVRKFDWRHRDVEEERFEASHTSENNKLKLPIPNPINLTVDSNCSALWNGQNNEEFVDSIITEFIRYYECLNGI